MKNSRLLAVLGALALLLAACGPAAEATPTRVAATPSLAPGVTPQLTTLTPTAKPAVTPTQPVEVRPKYGGVIRYVDVNDPRGWDGHLTKSSNADVRTQHNLNFSMLFNTYDATKGCGARLTPNLVQSWKWVSDTVLELKVYQGVKFHSKPPVNGREMTADDVAYSINRGLFKEPIQNIDPIAANVDMVEAMDRYTVRVRTKGPLGSLVEGALASKYGMVVLAPEAVEPYGNWNDPYKSYIGTGPFTFKEHWPGVKIVYEKHPNYFKEGLPYADRAEVTIIPDLSTQVAALRSGKVDLIQRKIPAMLVQQLEKEARLEVQTCMDESPPGNITIKVDKPPFNDVRIRRALSMAINRQTLLDTVLQGRGQMGPLFPPTSSPFSVTFDELPPEIRRYVEYHPDEARKLVAEAGHPRGVNVIIRASTRHKTPSPELLEAVVDMWEQVGIRAKIEWQDVNVWNATTLLGNYPALAMSLNNLGTRYLRYAPWRSLSPVSQRGPINDPQLDALIDQVTTELDLAKAAAMAKKLETRVIEQAYEISLPAAQDHAATNKWVKGYKFGDPWLTGVWLERIWLDR